MVYLQELIEKEHIPYQYWTFEWKSDYCVWKAIKWTMNKEGLYLQELIEKEHIPCQYWTIERKSDYCVWKAIKQDHYKVQCLRTRIDTERTHTVAILDLALKWTIIMEGLFLFYS